MLNRKGQNTAEYSILIALIIATAVAMQVYVRRGVQGRMKEVVDHVGKAEEVGGTTLTFSGDQYEPYYIDSASDVVSSRDLTETLSARGGVARTGVDEGTTRKTGSYEEMKDTSGAD